jgi:hypothetical protein
LRDEHFEPNQSIVEQLLSNTNEMLQCILALQNLDLYTAVSNIQMGKSLIDPPIIGGGLIYPRTMKWSNLPPELCKTGQITPSGGFGR